MYAKINKSQGYLLERAEDSFIIPDAWQSPSCSSPDANAPAKLKGYWTKVHKIFVGRKRAIGDVIERIRDAILPSVVEC